nr:MAG TPA: hypothetical protein [Caudoviricetes sp.]
MLIIVYLQKKKWGRASRPYPLPFSITGQFITLDTYVSLAY